MFGCDLGGDAGYAGLILPECDKGTRTCSKVCNGEERSLVPYQKHMKMLLPGNLMSLLNCKSKYKKSQLNTL